MSSAATDDREIRLRILIDRDMPDLFARLGGAKRPAREVIHLLRLGIQFERYFNGASPPYLTSAGPILAERASLAAGEPAKAPVRTVELKDAAAESKAFVEQTGLSADYFSSAPPAYVE
ncbi:hypothetical protein [Polaromonas sp.]|uniref:hypothetical protein n=1 Tax=Polaromonas sp. TaxID=1869339 RepID=UPI00272F2DD3|nr:hypothetical protein [Polaromonas sp.]MDP2448150.1 hypothetical protein [Polaromonas sp.]